MPLRLARASTLRLSSRKEDNMSIAAYNRGSRAISNQLFPSGSRHAPAKVRPVDPLPEGRLLVLVPVKKFPRWYGCVFGIRERLVSRSHPLENLARRRKLAVAAKLFEDVQMYGSAGNPLGAIGGNMWHDPKIGECKENDTNYGQRYRDKETRIVMPPVGRCDAFGHKGYPHARNQFCENWQDSYE